MSTLSSANVTDVNLVLKEHTHMRLCLNMLIFTHNLGNWLISTREQIKPCSHQTTEAASDARTTESQTHYCYTSFTTNCHANGQTFDNKNV